MSIKEIFHRMREMSRKSLARGRLEGWGRYRFPGSSPSLPGLSERLQTHADTPWIAQMTERLLAGEFKALGVAWPIRPSDALFPSKLWRLDPISGKLWPGADFYCFEIPYRHERRLGDIKYVWEINRLQFLQPLALQVRLTEDEASLVAIETAIQSWYAANPPFRGLGWNSGIELGLRAISLLVVTTLCGERLSSTTIAQIRAMLYAHAIWMDRYPSRFSSANNHLIVEAAGNFLIALAMPDLPIAARLEAKSRRILNAEAQNQFHTDGVPAEQSPTYGAFSAEVLWLCVQAAEAAGQPFSATISGRLSTFADFIGWLTDSRGQVPAIGDNDEGRVLWLGPDSPSYPVSICRRLVQANEPRLGLNTFRDGGYTVIREQRGKRQLELLFDHGPLGYLSIAAHGHADALSIVVTLDGKPLFVDPGTYQYHSGGVWRDWFRGTRAHNTLNIGGMDQSRISGAFNWSHKANTKLEQVRDGADWSVTGSHDGYRRQFGVLHRRTLFATTDGFAIRDQFEGDRTLQSEIVFQLAPGYMIRREGNMVIIGRDDVDQVTLHFEPMGDLTLAAGGKLGSGGGWVSTAFGHKVPAPRIAWHGEIPSTGVTTFVRILKTTTHS